MELLEIVNLTNKCYVSETGLGRLPDWENDTAMAPNGLESVRNENGILYRMFTVIQQLRSGAGFQELNRRNLERALLDLRVDPNDAGLTNRQPHGGRPAIRTQSMDNRVGEIAASIVLQDEVVPNGMISHWWKNWGCFNNVNPGRFSWGVWGQPGEIALYYTGAGRRAPLLFRLWQFGGILLQAKGSKIDAAEARLTWMRFWIMDSKHIKGLGLQRWLYGKVRAYWFKRTIEKYGSIGNILRFGNKHPMDLFQDHIGD